MNIIHDKLPHPAEETQPPFSLISNPSPTALKELLLLFVVFSLQPISFLFWCLLTHDRNTNTAVEWWRDEDEREPRTEMGGNYWWHESGESWASPQELSLQFHPWPNQKTTNPVWSCVAEGSQHLHLSQTRCLFMRIAIVRIWSLNLPEFARVVTENLCKIVRLSNLD